MVGDATFKVNSKPQGFGFLEDRGKGPTDHSKGSWPRYLHYVWPNRRDLLEGLTNDHTSRRSSTPVGHRDKRQNYGSPNSCPPLKISNSTRALIPQSNRTGFSAKKGSTVQADVHCVVPEHHKMTTTTCPVGQFYRSIRFHVNKEGERDK